MRPIGRWLIGGLLLAGGGLLTAWLSVAPWRVPEANQALIRLAWSGRPERLEACRRLSDAELEGVPVHMRQRVVCEGRSARYRLDLLLDGRAVLSDTLRGGGLRHDRPIHLLSDVPLSAGRYRLELVLARIDSATTPADSLEDRTAPTGPSATLGSASRDEREREERARARREALPERLRLDSVITVAAGEILLVSYDSERRRFVLLGRAPAAP